MKYEPTTHELKTMPAFWDAIADGRKTFEIRNNSNRGFQTGDIVVLERLRHDGGVPVCPETITARIGYVLNFEQKPNWVVFSLLDVEVK